LFLQNHGFLCNIALVVVMPPFGCFMTDLCLPLAFRIFTTFSQASHYRSPEHFTSNTVTSRPRCFILFLCHTDL